MLVNRVEANRAASRAAANMAATRAANKPADDRAVKAAVVRVEAVRVAVETASP
jgi:hypothetical protein